MFVLFVTGFVVTKPSAVGAWTLTSPQVSVSVFRGAHLVNERAYSVKLDSSANVYTTGTFEGTVDFDPGPGVENLTSSGSNSDIFVSKLDASGNYVWAKSFGSTRSDSGQSVEVDSFGNVYITGAFAGTVDFDPGPGVENLTSTPGGNVDVFVSKLDASGNYVWARNFAGPSAGANSVEVDSFGNVYTTGSFSDTADFDPGPGVENLTAIRYGDVFVSKLDASGNYVWAKSFGGFWSDDGAELKLDASGNIYTVGSFYNTVDFDPGPGVANVTAVSDGNPDIFVSKLDASGNYVWAKNFGSSVQDRGYSLALDSSANVYTTGNFRGTADFDPGPDVANLTSIGGTTEAFVSKLDASGNYVWAKSFRGNGDGGGSSVTLDSSGNVFTTGNFSSTVDFDPGPDVANLTSAGNYDVFVSKLDASGNYVWAKSVGGTSGDGGHAVGVDSSQDVYVTGSFSGTADFDTSAGLANLTSSGGVDVYVLKLNGSDGSSSISPSAPTSVTATGAANEQSVVSWIAPASTGGAVITGYVVTSSPGGRTCAWTSGPLSCTVTGLTNGTSYTFTVTASNANGAGSASSASSPITPSTTPDIPTSVTATGASNEQSVVSWIAPASTGGAVITGYVVTSSPGGRTCAWTSGPLSCTVIGLTNGTSYTFTVTASNVNGAGSASSASSPITPKGPQSITFVTIDTQLLGTREVGVSATATSALTIVFSSATRSVCTVSGSTVTLLSSGNCTINANQAGSSAWNAAPQVSTTFLILPSPSVGEPGVSIKNGASYSNSKQVTLNLIWPEYATSVRISNDGGFATPKTQTKELAESIVWELDDSVKGIYTKVVYVRFNGVADTTKTYTDDIILDTTAPTIETSTAVFAASWVDVLLRATDDVTGVNKVEVRNGTNTVTRDYATKMSVALADLALSVSSSGVQKSATQSIEIRVSDNAGNWTTWQSVTVAGLAATSEVRAPEVTAPMATAPAVRAPAVTLKKSATAKSIAAFAKIKVLSTSKMSLKVVPSSAKFCRVSGTSLKGLKPGFCRVTITVKPKKGKPTSRTITLRVAK